MNAHELGYQVGQRVKQAATNTYSGAAATNAATSAGTVKKDNPFSRAKKNFGELYTTLKTPVDYKQRNLTGGTRLRSIIGGTTNKPTTVTSPKQ